MKRFSLIALLLSYLLIIAFVAYYPKFNKQGTEATISYDVAGYYFYLPAIFIYNDIHHLAFQEATNNKYQYTPGSYQGVQLSDGSYTMKYTIGAAIMYAPFFFAAHTWANIAGINDDGFSPPYQRMISFGCLLYAFLGLWLLRKILLQYFSETATGLTIISLVLATNYLNYSAIDNAMTHNLLFTVFTGIIWFTIKFYKKPNYKYAIILGLLCGLATIIRPTDILICLVPIFWGVTNLTALRERLVLLFNHRLKVLSFIVFAAVIGSIQLMYWKITTGQLLFYSYEDQTFDWTNPHIIEGFFSYKKGWWLYTPFMLIIIPGFILLYKNHRPLFLPIFLFTLVNIYIVFSWSIWWYGGSLGQRSLIESYALLSLPIAAVFQALTKAKKWTWALTACFVGFTGWYNIVLTIQAHNPTGILDAENTNRTYFWATFGRLTIDNDSKRFLDTDEIYRGDGSKSEVLYENNIEYDTLHVDTMQIINGKKCLFVDKNHQNTQPYRIPNPPNGSKWLRVSATFFVTEKVWDVWKMPQFIIQFKNEDEVVKTKFIRVHRLMNSNQKRNLFFDVEIPTKRYTTIDIFLWNADGITATYMDDIRVEVLE